MILEPVEHQFCSDADAIRFYAARLYDLFNAFVYEDGDIHHALSCASILRTFGVDERKIQHVERVAAKNHRYPVEMFRDLAA